MYACICNFHHSSAPQQFYPIVSCCVSAVMSDRFCGSVFSACFVLLRPCPQGRSRPRRTVHLRRKTAALRTCVSWQLATPWPEVVKPDLCEVRYLTLLAHLAMRPLQCRQRRAEPLRAGLCTPRRLRAIPFRCAPRTKRVVPVNVILQCSTRLPPKRCFCGSIANVAMR